MPCIRCLGDKGGGTAIGDPGGVDRGERVVSEESGELKSESVLEASRSGGGAYWSVPGTICDGRFAYLGDDDPLIQRLILIY